MGFDELSTNDWSTMQPSFAGISAAAAPVTENKPIMNFQVQPKAPTNNQALHAVSRNHLQPVPVSAIPSTRLRDVREHFRPTHTFYLNQYISWPKRNGPTSPVLFFYRWAVAGAIPKPLPV